ncbi:Oxidoreductase [Petrocella atlantisensis]|uniref:Oxidoreductase n=1 Tax=Petrocella atlantisensis TaxID=2173034 RepID=A0A3P7PY24_9FIRM|nr:Gfo/Idh/MocA family oxidoreductase [Petrocella atlantisensis]VDN48547.1 Oxidoreductase [Petrocella atlantisensis]
MKVMIIGLGSMGKRRIRLLKKYDSTIEIVGVDQSDNRRSVCESTFHIKVYENTKDCLEHQKIEVAFICSSPLTHKKLITECLLHNVHVFSELNLVSDGYDYNIELAKERQKVLFLSSTFLYREEIIEISALVKKTNNLVNYSYHVGQYLPDWHPWESYNDFFVGNKKTNGCREIFAIELPWMIETFGEVIKFEVIKSKMSGLNIEYNDNYLLILEHSTGHKGMLAVDVVSRKAVRNLEIFGENLFLRWDGSPQGLVSYDIQLKEERKLKLYDKVDQLDAYSNFVVENAYYSEISAFFNVLNGVSKPIYDFEKDKEILKIIDKIEA